jgi:hypothetical protein
MRTDAQPPTGIINQPRNPRASPLYQCIRRHGDELDAAGLIHRPVEGQVLERFMAAATCTMALRVSTATGAE